MTINLSPLPHTWILDLDGTIVVHNGYKEGGEQLLNGIKEFWVKIPDEDYILILTARTTDVKEQTESFLHRHGLRFDHIIYNIPVGERIIINDQKPSGLDMALAINKPRNASCALSINIDNTL